MKQLLQLLATNARADKAPAIRAEAGKVYIYDVIDRDWGASAKALIDALAPYAGQPVALFMHHPPLTSGIDAMDRYGLLRGRAELARLVAGHGGVQFIACGHVHRPIAGVLGGAPVLLVSARRGQGLDAVVAAVLAAALPAAEAKRQ